MLNFIEFLRVRGYLVEMVSRPIIRQQVLDAIQADPEGDGVDNSPLSNYETRKNILQSPALQDILATSRNRGAIIKMVTDASQDENITVSDIIDAIVNGQE